MKLMIVDSSPIFCNALKELLPDSFLTEVHHEGTSVISRICAFRPDILVLAASLPGADGCQVLRVVQSTGLHPMVLLITPLITEYVLEQARDLRVKFMMSKPCDLRAAAVCICNWRDQIANERDPAQAYVRTFLLDMGFHMNLCGFRYLLTALCLLYKRPDMSMTKELYPAVAKLHGGSWQQIERGIRTAITKAWQNRPLEIWELYFSKKEGKPSNTVFLTRAVQCLQEIVGPNLDESECSA